MLFTKIILLKRFDLRELGNHLFPCCRFKNCNRIGRVVKPVFFLSKGLVFILRLNQYFVFISEVRFAFAPVNSTE